MMKRSITGGSLAWLVILVGILIYGILTGLGVTNTFWGWDARHSSVFGKVAMFVCLAAAGAVLWAWATGRLEGKKYTGLFVALIITLGFMASADFKFTGGDIKQRVTYLDNQGRVVDTDVLFNCYENFYHFNDHPELKEYVIKYGELPGRNRWNAFILAGDIPASTAPRADEDFPWHTGAYEMDLKQNGCK